MCLFVWGDVFPQREPLKNRLQRATVFFVRETGNQHFCSAGAFVRVLREDWYLRLKKISGLSRASCSPCRQKSQQEAKGSSTASANECFSLEEYWVLWSNNFEDLLRRHNLYQHVRGPERSCRKKPARCGASRFSKIFGHTSLFACVRDKILGKLKSLILTTCKP